MEEIIGIAAVKFWSSPLAVCRVATLAAGGQAKQKPAPPGAQLSPSFSICGHEQTNEPICRQWLALLCDCSSAC